MEIEEREDGVVLGVLVQPCSSRTEIVGPAEGGALKIKVTAPPREGKANRELIKFLSKLFGVAKSRIAILSGESSRNKRIFISEISSAEVKEILGDYN